MFYLEPEKEGWFFAFLTFVKFVSSVWLVIVSSRVCLCNAMFMRNND